MLDRIGSMLHRSAVLVLALTVAVFGGGIRAHGQTETATAVSHDAAVGAMTAPRSVEPLEHEEPPPHDDAAHDCLVALMAVVQPPLALGTPEAVGTEVSDLRLEASQNDLAPTTGPPRG